MQPAFYKLLLGLWRYREREGKKTGRFFFFVSTPARIPDYLLATYFSGALDTRAASPYSPKIPPKIITIIKKKFWPGQTKTKNPFPMRALKGLGKNTYMYMYITHIRIQFILALVLLIQRY